MKPVLFIVALGLVSFSVLGQNPSQKDKQDKPAVTSDQFEDAHRGIFSNQGDKPSSDAVRLTNQFANSAPGNADPNAKIARKNFIDEYIFGKIEKDKIPHAGLSSDEEFVRRVYLDATGMLPKPEAVRAFRTSTDPDKRDKLVDSLVGTEEFAEQWAWFYGDLFRLMNYAGASKNAFQYWNKEWLKVDRPYNDVVSDLLTGASKSHSAIPQLAFIGRILRNSGLKNRDLTDPENYGATTNRLDAIDETNIEFSRIFLGVNIECISCHDGAGHLEPLNMYLADRTRDQFSSQAAFFGKVRMIGIYNVNNSDSVLDNDAPGYTTGNDAPFYTESENRFPRTGKTYEPAFLLTGEKPRPGMEPRAEYARMLTSHPQFSRATVNLIWGKLMTVGFVEPWDGFDLARMDPNNPPPKPWTVQPTYPALMEALATDFREHNYSMQRLMKLILKSNAYALSSQFPVEWKDDYTDYYARKYVRVMTGPEVVDALARATGKPYGFKFGGADIQRVKQMTDLADVPGRGRGPGGNSDGGDVAAIMNAFFENNRDASPPPGNRPTVLQAVLMMSTGAVNNRVAATPGSSLQKLLDSGKTDEQIIEDMYMSSLSRSPAPNEKQYLLDAFKKDRKTSAEKLQWSLLNNIEFVLNH